MEAARASGFAAPLALSFAESFLKRVPEPSLGLVMGILYMFKKRVQSNEKGGFMKKKAMKPKKKAVKKVAKMLPKAPGKKLAKVKF